METKQRSTQRAMSQPSVIYANGPGQDKCVFSRLLNSNFPLALSCAPWILIENYSLLLRFKGDVEQILLIHFSVPYQIAFSSAEQNCHNKILLCFMTKPGIR